MTVQRALDHLVEDGFVTAHRRKGTFVAEHPPHLSHYALVFPSHPYGGDSWRHFWMALANEAAHVQRSEMRTIHVFHDIHGHTDGEDYRRLVKYIHAKRMAGIILASKPDRLIRTPILQEPGLPRIAVMAENEVPGVPALQLGGAELVRKILDYLRERGRKRPALLSLSDMSPEMMKIWVNQLSARSMDTTQELRMGIDVRAIRWARYYVRLLMRTVPEVRPDASIILDDNLVKSATNGVAEAGLRVRTTWTSSPATPTTTATASTSTACCTAA